MNPNVDVLILMSGVEVVQNIYCKLRMGIQYTVVCLVTVRIMVSYSRKKVGAAAGSGYTKQRTENIFNFRNLYADIEKNAIPCLGLYCQLNS